MRFVLNGNEVKVINDQSLNIEFVTHTLSLLRWGRNSYLISHSVRCNGEINVIELPIGFPNESYYV